MKIEIILKSKEKETEKDFMRLLESDAMNGDAEVVGHNPLRVYVASSKFENVEAETLPKFARNLIVKEIIKKLQREGFETEVSLI